VSRIARPVAGAALLLSLAAGAQDFMGLAGVTQSEVPNARTFGAMFSYAHDLGPHLAATFSYKNEGHVPGHHRDGHSVQFWAQTQVLSPQLTLAAGIGPYYYFDTTVAEGEGAFTNAHGSGAISSVSATWRNAGTPWFYQLRIDRVETKHNLDTLMVVAGVGYRLEQDGSFAGNSAWNAAQSRRDELVLLAGQTIVNSFESQSAFAKSLEYRHGFGPVLRGSLSWIGEGDARLSRRNGVVAQVWLEPSFLNDRFTIGLGLGPYFAVDGYRPADREVLGLLSTTFSYHFARGWVGRFTWHRSVSGYDRDSDILLFGAGYRF
jgi:hypothetical protein